MAMAATEHRNHSYIAEDLANQLIASARDMIPVLRAREHDAIAAGQVSSDTIADFERAGCEIAANIDPARFAAYLIELTSSKRPFMGSRDASNCAPT